MSISPVAVRGRVGRVRASAAEVADRLDGAVGQDHRPVRRGGAPVRRNGLPWVDFCKGQRKDDVLPNIGPSSRGRRAWCSSARPRRKTPCSAPRSAASPTGSTPGSSSPPVVNQFYFYCVDEDFGPFFLKFCTYFPYNAKLCINGHEYVKRQADQGRDRLQGARQRHRPVDDPAAAGDLRRSVPAKIDALLRKWLAICRIRSPPPIAPAATATTCRSCRPSSP